MNERIQAVLNLNKPKYPVYVISKGRFKKCLTALFFIQDNIDFKLVVEPQEAEEYSSRYGKERILVLPFSNLGLGSIPARNFVWEHAKSQGHVRHWIFDDNIRCIFQVYKGRRIKCNSNVALCVLEEFIERYENIGVAGFNYGMFVIPRTLKKPFYLNCHVYSALLIRNDLAVRWRGRYNEDTDLCLQVLANKLCTILLNVFCIDKIATMRMKGGNTDILYKGRGRLKMARSLERQWPGVVTIKRRFGRPQHFIKDNWKYFDTPLIRKKNVDFSQVKNNFETTLTQVKEIKSKQLKKFYEQNK